MVSTPPAVTSVQSCQVLLLVPPHTSLVQLCEMVGPLQPNASKASVINLFMGGEFPATLSKIQRHAAESHVKQIGEALA
jgi:hypothetical protein